MASVTQMLAVAKFEVEADPNLRYHQRDMDTVVYRTTNGQFMRGKVGASYLEGKQTWTFEQFLEDFKGYLK